MPSKKESENTGFIGHLFDFINRDLSKIDFRNIMEIGIEYLQLLYFSKEGSKLSNHKEKYNLFANVPLEGSEEELEKVKKHLLAVQKYLRTTLTDLVEKEPSIPAEQTGKRIVSNVDGKFVERFETKKVRLEKFDKNTEKQQIKALLLDHLINESLLPERFFLCLKKDCDNYFYHTPGGRPQLYCSKNCSSAVRMTEKRKRDAKKAENQ